MVIEVRKPFKNHSFEKKKKAKHFYIYLQYLIFYQICIKGISYLKNREVVYKIKI